MTSLKWKIAQKLEIRWWRSYLKHKSEKDYLEWKRNYWIEFLKKIGLTIANKELKLLDAGCGPAGIFTIFDLFHVTATDPLLFQYEQSLEIFDRKKYPNIEFYNLPIEKFNSNEKFDYIFCLNAINHVHDLNLSLAKLYDLLAINGTMVISTDVHRSSFLQTIFKAIPGDVLHPHQLSESEFDDHLKNAKFNILRSIEIKNGNIFNYRVWIVTKN